MKLTKLLPLILFVPILLTAAGSPDIEWKIDAHNSSVNAVAFSSDGSQIASGSSDSYVKLWSASDGSFIKEFQSHTQGVESVDISPDGSMLAEGYIVVNYPRELTGKMNLWDISSQTLLNTFIGCYVDFSPAGDRIAAGGGSVNRYLDVYQLSNGERLVHFNHGSYILDVAYSPDGDLVASAGTNNTVKLWSINNNQLVRMLGGHSNDINAIAFSPDGELIASGAGGYDSSGESTIKVWSVSDGALVRTLDGHGEWVSALSFSPDGQNLLSSGRDNPSPDLATTMKLWQVSDGSLLQVYDQEINNGTQDISYSPDGNTFVYGRGDGSLVLANSDGSGPPIAVNDLQINIIGGNVDLSWSDVGGPVDHYEVWRSPTSYFMPGDVGSEKIAPSVARNPGGMVNYLDTTHHLTEPGTNDYYLVLALDASNNQSVESNRVSAFDFALIPGQ